MESLPAETCCTVTSPEPVSTEPLPTRRLTITSPEPVSMEVSPLAEPTVTSPEPVSIDELAGVGEAIRTLPLPVSTPAFPRGRRRRTGPTALRTTVLALAGRTIRRSA